MRTSRLHSSIRPWPVWLGLGLAVGAPVQAADTPVGETRVSGQIYLDGTYLETDSHGTHSEGAGADLTRFYINLEHRYSPVWSVKLTTDINWMRDQRPTDLWLKHAYLEGAFSKALVLRVGIADMPWDGFVSTWQGYRYIGRPLLTRLDYGASADWGAHVLGTLGSGGRWQYAAAVVTGSSYKSPRVGDRADVEFRLGWQPSAHTIVAVGGYDGTRAQDGGDHPGYHTARRWNALAAYADTRFRLGAEMFQALDWNQVRSPRSDRASGWSAWASVALAPRWAVFARHDQTRTSEWLDPSQRDRYEQLGLEWSVSQQCKLAMVYKHERRADANGTLTAANELGLWAQIGY